MSSASRPDGTLPEALLLPVPDQQVYRARKGQYRQYAIDTTDPRMQEPLVPIAAYGIAGQSYYSRPNNATGAPLKDVPQHVLVRKGVAERLAAINQAVQASIALRTFFDRPVELYVDEGLRSQRVQDYVYREVFPRLIRTQYPDLSESAVLERRDQMIAKPMTDPGSPSPHATGAAVDVKLRYTQETLLFVPDTEVPMGHRSVEMGNAAQPDAFEHLAAALSADEERARRHRRVFYWLMRGGLGSGDSGFIVNPTEWWHWSYGDQLWAALTEAPAAFYGAAAENAASSL